MAEIKKVNVKQAKPDLKRKQNDQPEIPFKRKRESTTPDSSMSTRTYSNMSGKEKFEFFYSNKSPFSQHYPSKFKIDGVIFNCAEQYMMYQKAVIFKDKEFEKKIMATSNPVEQKKYGRQVRKFDKEVWKRRSTDVVERANEAKFSQDSKLKKALFATYPRLLVEASPRDRVWGIGLGRNNPKAWDMKTWRGRNLLGYTLTRVRDRMMKKVKGEKAGEGSVNEKKMEEKNKNEKMVTKSEKREDSVKTDKKKDMKTDCAEFENKEKVDSKKRENNEIWVNKKTKTAGKESRGKVDSEERENTKTGVNKKTKTGCGGDENMDSEEFKMDSDKNEGTEK